MRRQYQYSVWPDNSVEQFKKACTQIEKTIPIISKRKLVIDVDGSMIQQYTGLNNKEIVVFDDYEIGAVYVDSDIDLSYLFRPIQLL